MDSDFTFPIPMTLLKENFRNILISITPTVKNRLPANRSGSYTDSESSSLFGSREGMDVISHEQVHALRSIAYQMITNGQSGDCFKVYRDVRKTILEERLDELKIERSNIMYVNRLPWKVQQEKIQHWIQAARVCVRLFAAEAALTKQIFDDLRTFRKNIADRCFTSTVNDSAFRLFHFVDAISSGRKSPEKLFHILDLHLVLSELLPDIEKLFASLSGKVIRNQAVRLLSSLSETAREILLEFEKAVFGELTKFTVPEGSVHPLTKYVMSFIHKMVKYKQILTQLIVTKPSISDYIRSGDLDFSLSEIDDQGELPPLVLHLVWIVMLMKFKLQLKSMLYKQASSANLFMKNNVDYMVKEIRGSIELKELVGIDCWNRLISLVEANYQKPIWGKIFDFFKCSCS